MSCEQIKALIVDYMDGFLTDMEASIVRDHVAVCAGCKTILQREQAFRHLLANRPLPQVGSAQVARIFNAVKTHKAASLQKSFAVGFAGAMAAGLVLFLVAGVFIPDFTRDNAATTITLSLHETKNIHLVFNATENITNARMTLELPGSLELEDFPGRQQLAWKTDLHKGQNGLILPIVAHGAVSGYLVAKISYGDKVKIFHIRPIVIVKSRQSSEFYEFNTDVDTVG